jgi:FdhD protein
MQADGPTASLRFRQIGSGGVTTEVGREIAVERPVAIEFNGIGYAVLMATPADLEDLVYGFALAERLIDGVGDLTGVDCHDASAGTIIRATLSESCVPRIMDRVRHRASESSCGLCGIENLEQALRPLPRLNPVEVASDAAVFGALAGIGELQQLNRATGGVHAAALCGREGAIRLVREDIGRHNAFDKLIGAMLRGGLSWDGGFALLSSRCSYELVEKAVLSACPMLATISAPTSLALERADAAGLRLVVVARPDAMLVPDA